MSRPRHPPKAGSTVFRLGGEFSGARAFSVSARVLPCFMHSRSAAYGRRRILPSSRLQLSTVGAGSVSAGRGRDVAGPTRRIRSEGGARSRCCPLACVCDPQARRSRSRARTSREGQYRDLAPPVNLRKPAAVSIYERIRRYEKIRLSVVKMEARPNATRARIGALDRRKSCVISILRLRKRRLRRPWLVRPLAGIRGGLGGVL